MYGMWEMVASYKRTGLKGKAIIYVWTLCPEGLTNNHNANLFSTSAFQSSVSTARLPPGASVPLQYWRIVEDLQYLENVTSWDNRAKWSDRILKHLMRKESALHETHTGRSTRASEKAKSRSLHTYIRRHLMFTGSTSSLFSVKQIVNWDRPRDSIQPIDPSSASRWPCTFHRGSSFSSHTLLGI